MTSKVAIKEAISDDARALAEVWNRLSSSARPISPEGFDFGTYRYLRALSNDTPVAFLKVSRSQREGDPEGKFWAYLTLAQPDEATVMRALYERLEALPGVRVIFTMTHESLTARQRTLEVLGYREKLRSYGANLDVTTLKLSAFSNPETRLKREGISIQTLAELKQDPEYADKLYALYLESNRDIPEVGHSDTLNRTAFEAHLNHNDALPEAYHIAVHNGRYIAYSELFRSNALELCQEATAVLAYYRRKGVALALKLRGLAYAKKHGYTRIDTGMASNNAAMVTLNTRLGFIPQAAYITFSKNVR